MTTYVWSEHRERVVAACGDAPSAPLEQRVLDVWEKHPALVVSAVDHVLHGYERGTVRSVWPVLAKHIETAVVQADRGDAEVTDTAERSAAVKRGRQWLRATGLHFDREEEVEDELFGHGGKLRAYREDGALVEELLALWRTLRPAGERVEEEAQERAEAWKATQARIVKAVSPRTSLADVLAGREPRPEETIAETLAGSLPNPFLTESEHEEIPL